jgi:hypothetical protein
MALTTPPTWYADLRNDAVERISLAAGTISNATQAADHPLIDPPPAGGGQTSYPNADISDGSWTPSAGTDLYAAIADSSDTTYIRSSAGAASDPTTIALAPLSTPQAGIVTLRVRHRATP